MAKARKFTVTVDGKTLTRTSQSRVYTYVVVGTPSISKHRAKAARIAPDASDLSTFRYYTFIAAQQPGAEVVPPGWRFATSFDAERIEEAKAKIAGGIEGYMQRDQQERMARFEDAVARGVFTPCALTWCSRLDLAQKAAGSFKGYDNLRILPVDAPQAKAA